MNAYYHDQLSIETHVQTLGRTDDPFARLRLLRFITMHAEELRRLTVAEAVKGGTTYTALGEALGVTRQAVKQKYGPLP